LHNSIYTSTDPDIAATANILDSSTRLSNRLLLEVLSLLRQFMKTCNIDGGVQLSVNEQGSNNDDSQDYGDWTGFEEIAMQDETKHAANVSYGLPASFGLLC
jgi:hypothetical protein